MTEASTKPHEKYNEWLEERRITANAFAQRDSLLANLRLIIFISGIAIALFIIKAGAEYAAWLGLPVVMFGILIVIHDRILKQKSRAEKAVDFYERGLARIEDRWAGTGIDGMDWAPSEHPYAEDLDIFGSGSLFELLCTVRTRNGEERLSQWLCKPADPETIQHRQEAVKELYSNTELRETLGVLGDTVRSGLNRTYLLKWAASPTILRYGDKAHIAAWGITSIAALVLLGCAFWEWPISLFAGVFVIDILYLRKMKAKLEHVVGPLDRAVRDLRVLAKVAHVLEQQTFQSPLLRSLQERLVSADASASKSITRLSKLVEWMDAQRNQLFFPIAALVLWPAHFAYALEKWRTAHGKSVNTWFDAVGELEAVCALSMYAYEHPGDPFPVFTQGAVRYEGSNLGHPLLAKKDCVANSVVLNDTQSLIMISGSNMSGKSTLLRVIGINAVLAFAGAPVRAESLTLTPLHIAASLHITDSIQKGMSHFYAEILRLKTMLEMTKEDEPVLFLIDEMLHGTNSHDRHVGSEAVLRSLMKNGAIGLVTTHDLSLTHIAETMDGRATNVHFEDQIEGDKLVFDYRMREGIVQKSNALSLMRSIGLDV